MDLKMMKTNIMATGLLFAIAMSIISLVVVIYINGVKRNTIYKTSPEALQSIIIPDSIKVRVTCYRATVDECGNDLGICFDGSKVRKGIVALSPDLFYTTSLKLGDTIQILGTPLDGWYVVADKTANHIKNTADIYITNDEKGFSETGIIIKR